MGAALTIRRTDYRATQLRALAAKGSDGAQLRRLLALASVLDGKMRTEAAEQSGMDRQTLRDWVHRYNAAGLGGLKSRRSPGRSPALSGAQIAELKALVIAGPDPAKDQVVHWRCVDLRVEIMRRSNIEVHESTIGRWLRQLGLTRLQPRLFHPKKDTAAQGGFKKSFGDLLKKALLSAAPPPRRCRSKSGSRMKARVGQKGGHTYVWAPVGSRPAMLRDNRHDSVHLFGAICPTLGVGAAIIMPVMNTEAMLEHLKEISAQLAKDAQAMVFCPARAACHRW